VNEGRETVKKAIGGFKSHVWLEMLSVHGV